MSGAPWLEVTADQATDLSVLVVPRASRTELSGVHDERLRVRVAAPPVEGKANQALVAFFAKLFGVARSRVTIARGETGRRKVVRIADCDPARVREAVEREIGGA